jgi:hypothetical protein
MLTRKHLISLSNFISNELLKISFLGQDTSPISNFGTQNTLALTARTSQKCVNVPKILSLLKLNTSAVNTYCRFYHYSTESFPTNTLILNNFYGPLYSVIADVYRLQGNYRCISMQQMCSDSTYVFEGLNNEKVGRGLRREWHHLLLRYGLERIKCQ